MNKALILAIAFTLFFSASAFGQSIQVFRISPSPVEVGSPTSIEITIVDSDGNPFAENIDSLKIYNALTNADVADITPAPGPQSSYTIPYTPGVTGNYRLEARLADPCVTCSKSVLFTVNPVPRNPIPETSFLAVALVALSVVAIVAFKGRK